MRRQDLNLRPSGYIPVVPPHPNRLVPWEYERLFRRLKGYRRIFTRFDKLDVLFADFIERALIVETLRWC